MVHHADHTNFSATSKKEAYDEMLLACSALLVDNWVANTANVSSLLWHMFHSLKVPVNWTGFYVLDETTKDKSGSERQLILGPFQGKVACQTIAFGKGVCGIAAERQMIQLVPDVNAFPDHIACDGETQSEIVVPLVKDGVTVAVIDIDCLDKAAFDETDAVYLDKLADLLLTKWV